MGRVWMWMVVASGREGLPAWLWRHTTSYPKRVNAPKMSSVTLDVTAFLPHQVSVSS